MITLLSLNVEGMRHKDTVLSFIDEHQATVVCLYETPTTFIKELTDRGYFTAFAPMCTDAVVAPTDTVGVLVATKTPHTAVTHYYESRDNRLQKQNRLDSHTKSYPCISVAIIHEGQTYMIAATHSYDTDDGHETDEQSANIEKLLAHLGTLPPHILCGDMNMPRGYNTNYERVAMRYRDEIPARYTSSLDRALHRAGNRTDLNAPIFDIYMVDYIFSQSPYRVSDVQLHFGVSDHAAVTATIQKP
jgi:endonuclease/exonuclease/phosphatase family metal-dependent hydrolase